MPVKPLGIYFWICRFTHSFKFLLVFLSIERCLAVMQVALQPTLSPIGFSSHSCARGNTRSVVTTPFCVFPFFFGFLPPGFWLPFWIFQITRKVSPCHPWELFRFKKIITRPLKSAPCLVWLHLAQQVSPSCILVWTYLFPPVCHPDINSGPPAFWLWWVLPLVSSILLWIISPLFQSFRQQPCSQAKLICQLFSFLFIDVIFLFSDVVVVFCLVPKSYLQN